ncbi:MAG TPA: nitroreductase family deazaflavin-dependent oxidoreductase [Acidimicrobiia bacterium]|nr:nitroreductase family deazaflavin-dependent oxidoreductase [Acidimicrobiia bacterium]HLF60406.1 nitroreductase family deazaflavin-dependent oxidoreductase [Acidimicrobiia bacterium]
MGLAAELGYEYRAQNGFQRWAVRVGGTRPVSAVSRKVFPPADRFLLTLTQGRSTVTALFIGLPPIWLTTTGARSGAPRTVPLVTVPIDGELALLGTSFGQKATPAWVYNIENNPNVMISYRRISLRSQARPARPDEEPRIWELAGSVYPGYLSYGERASPRRIRLFVLESMPIG